MEIVSLGWCAKYTAENRERDGGEAAKDVRKICSDLGWCKGVGLKRRFSWHTEETNDHH
jgi:hypothetical protein